MSFFAYFVDSGENYGKRDNASDNHERQKTKAEESQQPEFFAISLPFCAFGGELTLKRTRNLIITFVCILWHRQRIAFGSWKRNAFLSSPRLA